MDRKTALELQASGSFPEMDRDLQLAQLLPQPAGFTKSQVDASGGREQARATDESLADEQLTDELLVRRCIGEALDGNLVDTRESCAGRIDVTQVGELLTRAKITRAKIWDYLQRQRPAQGRAEVQGAWRQVHLESVVCGGNVQGDDRAWRGKECKK